MDEINDNNNFSFETYWFSLLLQFIIENALKSDINF